MYYTITEVAKLLKVQSSKIRFWQDYFKIKAKKGKKELSTRRYGRREVYELVMISRLKMSGDLTLKGIFKKIKK
mgnify:CR=1 FL=1